MKDPKDLAVAYSISKRNRKAKGGMIGTCPECLSAGGRCMAHGGMAGEQMSEEQKSIADEIVAERKVKRMAAGGMVTNEHEDDLDPAMSFTEQPGTDSMHGIEDHDADETDDESDKSLVGQILRDRKKSRR